MTRRIVSALSVAALVITCAVVRSQSITLTGHVSRIAGRTDVQLSCGCAVGDSVSTVIELRTFFSVPPGMHRQALSIYPLTTTPAEIGVDLPEIAFAENSFRMQIGKRVWVNQFKPEPGQAKKAGQIQLSRPISPDQPQTFTSLFTNGLWIKRIDSPREREAAFQNEWVDFGVDSRPEILWNTTGTPIPAFDVMPLDKATIMKTSSFMGFHDPNGSGTTVIIQIDKASASPAGVAQLDLTSPALKAELERRSAEIDRNRRSPQVGKPNPFLPPPASPTASPAFVMSGVRGFNPCLAAMSGATKFASTGLGINLMNFYEAEQSARVAAEVVRADVQAWLLMMGPPVVCTAQILSAMAANSSKADQGTATRPAGVPSDWAQAPDQKNKGGYKFVDPNDPARNYVRIRPDGTIVQVKNGQPLDENGAPIYSGSRSDAAHYPASKFVFRP